MEATKPFLFNISGPYGVGKDTMLNHLLGTYGERVHRVGTVTTRPATPDADPSYRFVSDVELEQELAKGRWIVNRQLAGKTAYATHVDEIERKADEGKVCLHSIFPGAAGAGQLREIFGRKLVSIALLPTMGDQEMQIVELERRLIARGREDPETIRAKIATQEEQIAFILQNAEVQTPDGAMHVFDRILVNEKLDVALQDLLAYFRSRFSQL